MLRLDGILRSKHEQCETVVILDAGRTLTARDTRLTFWEEADRYQNTILAKGNPLRNLEAQWATHIPRFFKRL